MCDVLLPTTEVCMEVASRELITKDLIIRTEYEGQRRPIVTILEVPPQVIEEHLAIYLHQYDQILGATSDNLNGRFDIMLGRLAFVSVPNCLDFVAENQFVGSEERLIMETSTCRRPKSPYDRY